MQSKNENKKKWWKFLLIFILLGTLISAPILIYYSVVNKDRTKDLKVIDSNLLMKSFENSISMELEEKEAIEKLEGIEKPEGVLKISAKTKKNTFRNYKKITFIVNITIDNENYKIDKTEFEVIGNRIGTKDNFDLSQLNSSIKEMSGKDFLSQQIFEDEITNLVNQAHSDLEVIIEENLSAYSFLDKMFLITISTSNKELILQNQEVLTLSIRIGTKEIIYNEKIKEELERLVADKMNLQNAEAALKNFNFNGLESKTVQLLKSDNIQKASKPEKFKVQIYLNSKDYEWDNNAFEGEFIILAPSISYTEDLNDVIKIKDLGIISDDSEGTIKQKLKDHNPNLDTNSINIILLKEYQIIDETKKVKITSSNTEVYSGEVEEVTFMLRKEYIDGITYYIDFVSGKEMQIKGSAPAGTKEITNIGYNDKFQAYKLPSTVEKVPNFISSNILSLSNLFDQCINFNQDLSSWNTSNVTNMSSLFYNAKKFNGDISTWNTSNVKDMSAMFYQASNFNGDISTKEIEVNNIKYKAWNTSNVTKMSTMFYRASNFNGNISNWNTANVKIMNGMFYEASNFNRDLIWNIKSLEETAHMFYNATKFNGDISSWNDVTKILAINEMFYNAISYNRNLSNLTFKAIHKNDYDKNTISWQEEFKPKFL
ncbi:BspA family leucine-rich repeat surface protein [Mesoplasma florum]|uniref:BspA family leucine-rich repeat surface protein n=1 Tax=Mesoplasma florum TaxID=2151 RepID=UPI000BE377DD|nr:BspA family leucine-rich repeat surface protein [Mesoplasma florum]ATI74139.1 hypothetical protein CQZ70_02690 [Mesoplasma florum]